MLPTRTQWAIFAFVFALNFPLFAQKSWMPLQKEWLPRVMHLWMLSKKTVPKSNQATTCLVSNEITIVILPCSDSQKKENAVFSKPIQ